MKNILYVDACPRSASRTRKIAEYLLGKMENGAEEEVQITHLKLSETELTELDENLLIKRTQDCKDKNFEDPMYQYAKQFAQADRIVIAAPFWDLSFPAILKKYIETISVTGITFRYSEEGYPIGMCQADRLYYVTSAGGPIFNDAYGFGYVKEMAGSMYGIPECVRIAAENLDIIGADIEGILKDAYSLCDSCL